jgi:hypothetical protein
MARLPDALGSSLSASSPLERAAAPALATENCCQGFATRIGGLSGLSPWSGPRGLRCGRAFVLMSLMKTRHSAQASAQRVESLEAMVGDTHRPAPAVAGQAPAACALDPKLARTIGHEDDVL